MNILLRGLWTVVTMITAILLVCFAVSAILDRRNLVQDHLVKLCNVTSNTTWQLAGSTPLVKWGLVFEIPLVPVADNWTVNLVPGVYSLQGATRLVGECEKVTFVLDNEYRIDYLIQDSATIQGRDWGLITVLDELCLSTAPECRGLTLVVRGQTYLAYPHQFYASSSKPTMLSVVGLDRNDIRPQWLSVLMVIATVGCLIALTIVRIWPRHKESYNPL